jgi:hypothetical protein
MNRQARDGMVLRMEPQFYQTGADAADKVGVL